MQLGGEPTNETGPLDKRTQNVGTRKLGGRCGRSRNQGATHDKKANGKRAELSITSPGNIGYPSKSGGGGATKLVAIHGEPFLPPKGSQGDPMTKAVVWGGEKKISKRTRQHKRSLKRRFSKSGDVKKFKGTLNRIGGWGKKKGTVLLKVRGNKA